MSSGEAPVPERDWQLAYDGYAPAEEGLREALCTLGNGYFATRGAAPECAAGGAHYPGTYLAGGYNRRTTHIAGRDVENEDLVNLPNWLRLTLRIDGGPWFRVDDVEVLAYRQVLDLRRGVLERRLRFRDPEGRITAWSESRLVSMHDPHRAALAVDVTAENWGGRLTVRSGLDAGVRNAGVERYRELESRHLETLAAHRAGHDAVLVHCRTNQSRLEVAQAARTRLYRGETLLEAERRTVSAPDRVDEEIALAVRPGDCIRVEKLVTLYTSRDAAVSEAAHAAAARLDDVARFDELLAAHRLAWRHLWEQCDVRLETDGDPGTLRKLRTHVFHLLQTASPHTIDLDAGAPARGWHGEAYRGHVFWDELFVFPFLSLRLPLVARELLMYRYRRLPAARRAARRAGLAGAMYPWQSGSSGREESQRVHLNPRSGRWIPDHSHRQRHIGLAVAYNVWHYHQVSDDHEFTYFYGAEMLLEIARFWASLATYDEGSGRYDIKGVMGPDEFHTAYPDVDPEEHGGLDNNAYTNVMAAWVLMRAQDVLAMLPDDHCRALRERLALAPEELERWEAVSRGLKVPFHGDGIVSQFAGYEALAEIDWEGLRERHGDVQRLDRILEAEGDDPNRYQASKQADVLMLFYLFSAEELRLVFEHLGYTLERDAIPRNVDYYLERTSHGSTLSWVVHAWVMARADRPRSWELFQSALDADLADIQGGTTPEGIHLGAMGGTVDITQRCFLGIDTRANVLHFDPVLPAPLGCVEVLLRYRRHKLEVEVTRERLRIRSRPTTAPPVTIAYRQRYREVSPGQAIEFRLLPARRVAPGTGAARQ